MKQTQILMGMPITVEIQDELPTSAIQAKIDETFAYFGYIDDKFSTYKPDSEISRINKGKLLLKEASEDMKEVFRLSEETKQQTHGYFDIKTPKGLFDPSGLVKGWAIWQAAQMLEKQGLNDFFIEAGGDVQAKRPLAKNPWTLGIRNPFKREEIVKVLKIRNEGVATSGTYIRGQHIYNPLKPQTPLTEIVSLTVVGPNVYEADRFATAAFAMGKDGIAFIKNLSGFEGYQIDKNGQATFTSGFNKYL